MPLYFDEYGSKIEIEIRIEGMMLRCDVTEKNH
jgi:hypothetical protein